MSVGISEKDQIRALTLKLKEKEEDITLAAQVGQSLLQEIDKVCCT